jgi:hypothetical protein
VRSDLAKLATVAPAVTTAAPITNPVTNDLFMNPPVAL